MAFHRRVAAADDHQHLIAEQRQRAIADGAGANAAIPQRLFAGHGEALGGGAGGDDHGLGPDLAAVSLDVEGTARQVNVLDGLGEDAGAVVLGLGAHTLHQLRAGHALGKAGKGLDVGRRRQLTPGGNAPGHKAFKHKGRGWRGPHRWRRWVRWTGSR